MYKQKDRWQHLSRLKDSITVPTDISSAGDTTTILMKTLLYF